MSTALLSLDITASYRGGPDVLRQAALDINAGETVGLVGGSGSGKSTLALAVLGLLGFKNGSCRGRIEFAGQDLTALSPECMRRVRGRDIALVLQSPMTALNPCLRIGTQLRESWNSHAARSGWCAAARNALENVGLPTDDEFLRRYPAQVSVGQAQRVLIAMAILHRPKLIIADEATSALDVITQAEILDLFAALGKLVEGPFPVLFQGPA